VTAEGTTVTAVVVHYRGGDHLDRCVDACLVTERITEVLVVDNEGVGSELRARFAGRSGDVRVLDMPSNLGFGRAANAGMAAARGDAVLVLNQDVVLPAASLDAMLDAGRATGAWIVAPRLYDAGGRERSRKTGFAPPLRWSPPGPSAGPWRYAPYVVGAVMLFMPGHTDVRFDERFFMYGEDEDLCWRVWAEGGVVIAHEEAAAMHAGGTATATRWSPRMTEWRILWGRARFVRKHAGWTGVAQWAGRWSADTVRAKRRLATAKPA
jgi:N-acetylglucosaminyl-diphospho-decaprenol L-rhamnosyltransferase